MDNSNIKDSLLKAIETYRAEYKCGFIRVAIKKDEGKFYAATITFTDNDKIADDTLDYGVLLLIRRKLSVDDTIGVIERIYDFSTLEFNEFKFQFQGSFSQSESISSISKWRYLACEYPRVYANISLQTGISLPYYPLVKPGKPLYPDGRKAVLDFLEMSGESPESNLIIQVPDYRVRISKMIISGNRVKVNVEARITAPLLAKFYADAGQSGDFNRADSYRMKSNDVKMSNGSVEYEFPKKFDYILVSLMNGETGELLDYRGNDFRWSSEGVEIEMNEEGLRELISRGENLNQEFKQELRDDDFLETVVAFANTKGGIILLGVNDNCHVTGCKIDSVQLNNLIEGNLDPKPKYKIKYWQLDNKPITAIEVEEGDNKPYVHREKGPYVRSSSNDRPPTRPEMDTFYSNRSFPR
jgi:hypothetical protein